MLSTLNDFVARHRKKLIFASIVVGGSICVWKYAQNKLIEFQDKQAREFLEKTRRLQHFDSTERTSNQVIIGMTTEVFQAIIKECNTNELIEQLRQNPENKLELWEEMKIVAFTRLATYVYASSMMAVSLRVLLNVLGGYLYRDITLNKKKISDELKQQYLSLIGYFIREGGLTDLVQFLRTKVVSVMKQLPLTKELNLYDIEQLFLSLTIAVSSDPLDPISRIAKYLLPSQEPEHPLLQTMYVETLDVLESDDVANVCADNVARGFSLAVDAIGESLGDIAEKPPTASVQEILTSKEEPKESMAEYYHNRDILNIAKKNIPLAKIIPIVSGITAKGFDHKTVPQNLATTLVTFNIVAEKTKVLGANVYETFASS